MIQFNGHKKLNGASRVLLGAGLGGLVIWLGVRGSRWLKSELAYQRWRRQRVHHIIVSGPPPERAHHVASDSVRPSWGGS